MSRLLPVIALFATFLLVPVSAEASTLVTRNPQGKVSLAVDSRGIALLTVRTNGQVQHILAWGAINMSRGRLQLDYSGGTGMSGADWRTHRNTCRPYRGGKFPGSNLIVAACTARDGSHWAAQTWTRIIPNYGGIKGTPEVHLSHWRNPVADLKVVADWSRYGPSMTNKWPHLFGLYTWHGIPVAVDKATPAGVPLDDKGRNLYLDSLNPDYGFPTGQNLWRRVNGFLANKPYGQFCFEIGPKRNAPIELGRNFGGISSVNRYRLAASGPGVTPVVRVTFNGPPSPYDPYWQLAMNEQQRALIGDPDATCGTPKPPTF